VSETVYIGVGSNIEPEINLVKALNLLCDRIEISAVSSCYRSKALDRPEQSDFINCVWKGATDLDAETVKFLILREIEITLGRIRTADRYAPRTIDLDILLFGPHCINTERLTIPDPDILERNFIAVPLMELDPLITIPGTNISLADQTVAHDTGELERLNNLTNILKERIHYGHKKS
jgi:dihydroneopterin aldolase/2-amino-4-hydroxy-6-hydroxymethyldihydropteridine diphosphokinase